MNSCVLNESTSSASTCLQANILNLNDSTPKSFLRHMSNRNRSWQRIGNHEISGTIQEPALKLSKKINSNRSVHREERMRELTTSVPNISLASINISSESGVTMSDSGVLKSNDDSTPKFFSQRPSEVKCRWQEFASNGTSGTRDAEPDESEESRRKRSKPLINRNRRRKQINLSVENESTSSAHTSRAKRVAMSVSDDLKSDTLYIHRRLDTKDFPTVQQWKT